MTSGKRTFQRRTKATPPPGDDVTTTPATDEKLQKRGPSKFKSRENARNETSARRPAVGAGARRSERPTRNFVRRRPGTGAPNVTTSTPPSAPSATATTRRPFRIASRRRPGVSSTTSTIITTTTSAPSTTLTLESEESLQDIGDIDAIEDPSLEPRTAKRLAKTPRRPIVNLNEEPKDQNPSATNDEERKRQSKKYSSTFKQNQLDDLIKAKSGEITTESGTTVEEYNAETALALATHQLITAPLPVITDYEVDTKPTKAKTTQKYKETRTGFTNSPANEDYSTVTFRTIPTSQDFIQPTIRDAYNIYDIPSLSTFYEDSKTTADYTAKSRRPYTATYEPSTKYNTAKTTEDVSTTNIRQTITQDIEAAKVTGFISTDTYPTVEREGYTYIPTSYAPRISTTFEVPKQIGTLNRFSTTPVYQILTDQYVSTTRGYAETPERSSAFSTQTAKEPRGFSSVNVITPGYSGVQRGGTKYLSPNDKPLTPTADSDGYSTSGYRSSSQNPVYFTKDYLLESPVTKTYDDEYQYISPTTPQTSTSRKVFRKKIQRKISTTLRPTSTTPIYGPEIATTRPSRIPYIQDSTSPRITRPSRISYIQEDLTTPALARAPSESTTKAPRPSKVSHIQEESTTTALRASYPEVLENPKPSRVPSKKPFEKVSKVEPNRTHRPVVNYDYYDDSAEKVALKYAEGTKVILHGRGSIECLDVGNFPHPSSCKKFISCARMEFGSLLGWEYVCPKGLSFDPVGGICNWSAGLGCDEKDN